jgi:hypothetical protein
MRSMVCISCVLLGVLAASCATTSRSATPRARRLAPDVATKCDIARDRAAIRAMAGEFEVSFSFAETDVLSAGYERHAPYYTEAKEVVEILHDSERSIVLQHVLILAAGGGQARAMKHWRQDWVFEDTDLVEFKGDDSWEHRLLAPSDAVCTWSQAVFEVTDGPRYESIGRWVHAAGRATWTSQSTFRPLPRREYTERDDYDVLVGENRHVVTADGWLHQQDNMKLVLAENRRLVRERGENHYVRRSLPEARLARDYLRETAAFWHAVRAQWSELMSTQQRFRVLAQVDEKPLHEFLFPLADAVRAKSDAAQRAQADQAIARFLAPSSPSHDLSLSKKQAP